MIEGQAKEREGGRGDWMDRREKRASGGEDFLARLLNHLQT